MKKNTTVEGITFDDLVTLLSTALCGSFWAGVDYPQALVEAKSTLEIGEDPCFEEVCAAWLLKDPKNYIIIYDIEADYDEEDNSTLGEDYWRLTLEDIRVGWGKAIDTYKGYYGNGLPNLDNMDMIDADAVLQNAIFGDIIFG